MKQYTFQIEIVEIGKRLPEWQLAGEIQHLSFYLLFPSQ